MIHVRVIILLLASAAGLFAYVKHLERVSLFFPQKQIDSDPGQAGLAFEDVYLTTGDGVRIHGWFIPADEARLTILFFHGNAGNISHRLEKARIFNDMGVNVFLVDYRGYGRSEGRPTEAGVYEDATACWRYLTEDRKIPAECVVVYGESLGGAVAVDLAARRPVAGLITEVTFSSLHDMARKYYPYIPSFMIADMFDSVSKVRHIAVPKLFISALDDQVVPFALGKRLYEAAAEPKSFCALPGTHNEAYAFSSEKYLQCLRDFPLLRGDGR